MKLSRLFNKFLIILVFSIIFLFISNFKVYGKTLEVDGQKYEFPDTYPVGEYEENFEKYYDDLDFESYKNLEDKGYNEILAKYNYDMEVEEAAYFCLKYGEKYFNKEYISLKTLNWVYSILKTKKPVSNNFDNNTLLKAQEMVTNVAVYKSFEIKDWKEDVKEEQNEVSEEKKKAADKAWNRFQQIKNITNFDEYTQEQLYELEYELQELATDLYDAKRYSEAEEVRNYKIVTSKTNQEKQEEEEKGVKDDPPDLLLAKDSAEHTPDEIIGEAKDFGTYTGETKIKGNNLLNSSKTLTNILMVVSIGVAVIVGSMMGIRIMIASAEEKASIKESMIPYLFGAFIAFGAFAIWNVFITIFQSVE